LAQIVHKNLVREIRRRDRGIRRGLFYVIHNTNMPAILIEPCYITEPYEERLAGNRAFQAEVVKGLFRGLLEYSKRIK
jgi:N-acetylmuramoyl-L-alanine amidase